MKFFIAYLTFLTLSASSFAGLILSADKVGEIIQTTKMLKPCRITKLLGGFWEYTLKTEGGYYLQVKPFRPWGDVRSVIILTVGKSVVHGAIEEGYTYRCEPGSDLERKILFVLDQSIKNDQLNELEKNRLIILKSLFVDRKSFPQPYVCLMVWRKGYAKKNDFRGSCGMKST